MDLLVVYGEALVRQAVVGCLRDAGFGVADAAHAEAALELAAAADGPPAVPVTDGSPRLGSGFCGLALAAAMHRHRPRLGVLHVTGHPERLAGRRLGARGRWPAKPFSPTRLAGAVRQLIPDPAGPAPP